LVSGTCSRRERKIKKTVGTNVVYSRNGTIQSAIEAQQAVSIKRKSSSGKEINRSYTLTVHVKAVNDEMPVGLNRVLRILENGVKDVPAA
jgi:hypothetical protein